MHIHVATPLCLRFRFDFPHIVNNSKANVVVKQRHHQRCCGSQKRMEFAVAKQESSRDPAQEKEQDYGKS